MVPSEASERPPGTFTVRFNVSQLLKEPVGATRQYAVSDESLELSEDLKAADISGHVKFTRLSKGVVLATGSFSAKVVLPCSRCLQPADTLVPFELEAEYQPSIDVVTGVSLEEPEDVDSVLIIDANHNLDLSEAVRQHILINLPMQPLCRPDCAGLCNQCGQDLNAGRCSCSGPLSDERWTGLSQLLQSEQ